MFIMGAYDMQLGSMIVASWANAMLYTLELAMGLRLLARKPQKKRDPALEVLPAIVLLIDTVGTVCVSILLYFYCVSHWGDEASLDDQFWPYAVNCLMTGAAGLVLHVYLVRRFWILSKNRPITGFLAVVTLLAFAGCIWTSATLLRYPSLAEWRLYSASTTVWMTGAVAADAGIALALAWKISTVETAFESTRSTLRRARVMALETGALTSFVAIVTLVLFVRARAQGAVAVAIELCLGRVYSLTLFYSMCVSADAAANAETDAPRGESVDLRVFAYNAEGMFAAHTIRIGSVTADDPLFKVQDTEASADAGGTGIDIVRTFRSSKSSDASDATLVT